jgi:hypothetical protein
MCPPSTCGVCSPPLKLKRSAAALPFATSATNSDLFRRATGLPCRPKFNPVAEVAQLTEPRRVANGKTNLAIFDHALTKFVTNATPRLVACRSNLAAILIDLAIV